MTLATRCPNCGAVFKVVQDQLRVSEGWVRCGRCAEVFNAAKHMVDPSTGEVRCASMAVRSAFPEPAAAEAPGEDYEGPEGDQGQFGRDVQADVQADVRADDLVPVDHRPLDPVDRAEAVPPASAAGAQTAAPSSWNEPAESPEASVTDAPTAASQGALPSFVRSAQRAQRWRHPGVRVLLALGMALGALLLAGQWLYVERDQAAARWPALRPLLSQACGVLGCRVEAARALDALTVESSGLVRVEKTDLYRLAVTLRNQRDFEVALPALELSLTDAQGRLLARRVLRASELGAAASTLAAASELAMQATIQVTSEPVAGYTIELFYP